jgi:DNA recombination protein RmuC
MTLDLADPRVLAALAAAVALALVLALTLAAARRAARAADPVAWAMQQMGARVQALSDGQQQLAGALGQVAEGQSRTQTQFVQLMEVRLSEVAEGLGEALQGSALRTARSLADLQARLEAIDRAQENIERLSGDVLGLQDILSNKQARGAFGEMQLHDIVARALPPDAFRMQATLPNGRRADCLIQLPEPPGPIAIDAKFPLEPWEALCAARNDAETAEARRQMRAALRAHIRAIADSYILPGHTAEGALMFVPSEAVYAEIHARFGEQVREGFALRVWIVSPTTCMATLTTLRAVLRDARLREQTGAIRRELAELGQDLTRMGARMDALDRHFGQAARDLADLRLSADKAGRRAARLERVEFDGTGAEAAE